MAVIFGFAPARDSAQHRIDDSCMVITILQTYVFQKLIKSLLCRFTRWLGPTPRISDYGIPLIRALHGNRAVIRIHLLPWPERPSNVIGFEIFRGRPIDSTVPFAGFTDPNRRIETFSIVQIFVD